MSNSQKLLCLSALLAVSACATATPPTATLADFDTAIANLSTLNALADTTVPNMPTSGMATYNGIIGFEVTGDADGAVLGDLSMAADFSAATMTGSATNLNALGGDIEDQLLGGTLTMNNGAISGNGMSADLTGTLSGVAEGIGFSTTANLSISGTFHSTNPGTIDADVITGTVSGYSDGDIYLLVTGQTGFYACTSSC